MPWRILKFGYAPTSRMGFCPVREIVPHAPVSLVQASVERRVGPLEDHGGGVDYELRSSKASIALPEIMLHQPLFTHSATYVPSRAVICGRPMYSAT